MMKRTTVAGPVKLVAYRLPEDLVEWSKGAAVREGVSATAYLEAALAAPRAMYGLPATLVAHLRTDAARLELPHQAYMRHVLASRAEAVSKNGPGFDAPRGSRRLAKESAPAVRVTENRKLVTYRLPEGLVEWSKEAAARDGISATEYLETALAAARAMYGLPAPLVARLRADADRLGLPHQAYLQHVLAWRAEAVIKNGAGFDAQRGSRRAAGKSDSMRSEAAHGR